MYFAVLAGVDLDCGPYYMNHLPAAVAQGLLSEAVVDAAALRVLVHQFKLGAFDPQESDFVFKMIDFVLK